MMPSNPIQRVEEGSRLKSHCNKLLVNIELEELLDKIVLFVTGQSLTGISQLLEIGKLMFLTCEYSPFILKVCIQDWWS